MNIMFVSVNQRTREIGLRKAVGATNADILTQFLIEAIMLTFLGGLIGALCGATISYLVSLLLNAIGQKWDFVVTLEMILLPCVISVLIGLVFGIYPARRASRLNPIEALRYE
jgi:putative ABC transport system permease protein